MPSIAYLQIGQGEAEAYDSTALGQNDRLELLHRLLHIAVHDEVIVLPPQRDLLARPHQAPLDVGVRSEEHTSELQSRLHLVCRLLLEKKKKRRKRRLCARSYT